MRFASIVTATLAFLTSTTTSASSDPVCGKSCMRRFLYETAYASSAAGVSQVMAAYNATSWCTAEWNQDLCLDSVRMTVSKIAASAIKNTTLPSEKDSAKVVEALDVVSRRAAVLSMSWASQIVTRNATEHTTEEALPPAGDKEAVGRMKWTMFSLSQQVSSGIDNKALQTAIDTHDHSTTPGSFEHSAPNSSTVHSKDDHTSAILGSTIPAAVLGPLLGIGACTDPALCGKEVPAFVRRILESALGRDVLPASQWLRYLLNKAKQGRQSQPSVSPSDDPSLDPPIDPADMRPLTTEDYNEWCSRPENGGVEPTTQQPPADFNPGNEWATESTPPAPPGGEPALPPGGEPGAAESTNLLRGETYNPGTSTLQQQMLQEAPDLYEASLTKEVTTKMLGDGKPFNPYDTLRNNGYRPYRVLGEDGNPLPRTAKKSLSQDKVVWEHPSDLQPVNNGLTSLGPADSAWEDIGTNGEKVLTNSAGEVALDSIGNPIMGLENTPGGPVSLMSLQPKGPIPGMGEPGPSNWYNLVDSQGKLVRSTDASKSVLRYDDEAPPKSLSKAVQTFSENELNGEPKPPPRPKPKPKPRPKPSPSPTNAPPDEKQTMSTSAGPETTQRETATRTPAPTLQHSTSSSYTSMSRSTRRAMPTTTSSRTSTLPKPIRTHTPTTLSTITRPAVMDSSSYLNIFSTSAVALPPLVTPTGPGGRKPCECTNIYALNHGGGNDNPMNQHTQPQYCVEWQMVPDPPECGTLL